MKLYTPNDADSIKMFPFICPYKLLPTAATNFLGKLVSEITLKGTFLTILALICTWILITDSRIVLCPRFRNKHDRSFVLWEIGFTDFEDLDEDTRENLYDLMVRHGENIVDMAFKRKKEILGDKGRYVIGRKVWGKEPPKREKKPDNIVLQTPKYDIYNNRGNKGFWDA